MRWFSLAALLVFGCAEASRGGIRIDDAQGSGQKDGPGRNNDAPMQQIDAPSSSSASKFVVEISAPASTSGFFVLGSTTGAETHTGYWSSAGCNQSTPETESAAGQTTHNIINVNGTNGGTAITLSETANNTIAAVQTISCNNGSTTSDNQWFRIFQLSDFPQITGALQITSITFGVEQAGTSPVVTVKVGMYSGALDGTTINSAQVTSLAQATTTPADTSAGEMVTVNLSATIPH